jgi:hypothetical protein
VGNLGKQSRKLCNWNQWHNQTNITIFFVQFGIQLCCFLPNCDRNSEAQQAAAHTKTSARPHLHLHDSNNSIKTESKNFCQHLLLNDNLLGFSAFSQNISRLKCCSKGDPSYFSTIMQITNNSNHCTMWYVAIPCLVWKNSSTIIGSVYSVWKWAWIDAYWEKSFIVVAGGRGRWWWPLAGSRWPLAVGGWPVAGRWPRPAAPVSVQSTVYQFGLVGMWINFFRATKTHLISQWHDRGTLGPRTCLSRHWWFFMIHVVKWRRRSSSLRDFFFRTNCFSKHGVENRKQPIWPFIMWIFRQVRYISTPCPKQLSRNHTRRFVPSRITRSALCNGTDNVCVCMCVALVWGWSGMHLAKS